MTTVVPTSEEDPALAVVRFTAEMSWADAGPEVAELQVTSLCMEAQECMIAGRWLDLASLMLTSADLIFSKTSEKDLECIFTIICNLVTKPESLDETLEMAKLISTKLTQQPNEKPGLRLKILFNLYNLLENPYSRFFVYMKALKLALHGKVVEHVIPSFKKMDSFLKEWNLGVHDQRELYLSVSNILKENKGSAKERFKFLTKYLATFSDDDVQTLGEAKEEAVHSIIEFVKAPDMFQCDLVDMPAVAQLEKDTKDGLVYELLKIFLTQRLDAYLDFHSANSAVVNSYGLVHEDCMSKMRLMSLVDLASDESSEIPYALIRDSLQINDDEVELWVVKAITAKLIDCKLNQLNQVVIVSRRMDRVFGPHEWQTLRTKLETLRPSPTPIIHPRTDLVQIKTSMAIGRITILCFSFALSVSLLLATGDFGFCSASSIPLVPTCNITAGRCFDGGVGEGITDPDRHARLLAQAPRTITYPVIQNNGPFCDANKYANCIVPIGQYRRPCTTYNRCKR